MKFLLFLSNILFLLYPNVSFTQAPTLGSTSSFSLFTAAGAFSNDGASTVVGDVGTHVGAFSGFLPGVLVGQKHVADPASAQAASDVSIAYSSFPGGGAVIGVNLGNAQILTAGVYAIGAAATLSGVLTFNGSATDLFIVQINGALSTNSNSSIKITGGASECNVFWQINGAFALGTNSSFRGTVVGSGAITLNIGSSLTGRAITTAGAISLHTTNVSINPPPTANISYSGSTNICQGQSVNLTASSANAYPWSNGAVSKSISVSTAGNYSVTVTDYCGIATSSPSIVTVNPIPTATISANGPINFCQGSSVMLTASGGSSYLWSNGATSTSITVTASGNYTVIASNAAGCTGTSASTSVTVTPSVIPTVTANGPLTFCQGGSVILTSSTTSGNQWNNGATTQSITVTSSGSYSVTTSANCGGTSSALDIVVNPIVMPTITASGPITFCQIGSVVLTASAANGFLWNTGATTQSISVNTGGSYTVTTTGTCAGTSAATVVTISAGAIPTIAANGPLSFCQGGNVTLTSSAASAYLWSNGATTQSITVTNAGNYSVTTSGTCAGTSTITSVIVIPATIPTITANGPLTFCQGGSVILTSSAISGNLWSNGVTTPSITVMEAGNYSVTTTANCGGSSIPATIIINPDTIPTISANGPLSFCPSGSVILTSSTGMGYLWSTGATTQSITVKSAGSYRVTTTGNCGGTSIPSAVTINPSAIPTITASGPLTFCPSDSVILTASGASGYLWSNGATTQSITVTTAGNYSVTTTGVCAGTSATTVVMISSSSTPTVSASGPLTFCQGGNVILTASSASGYLWSNGATTQSITITSSGNYSLSTSGSCGGISVSVQVNVIPTLVPVITTNGPLSFCPGGSVILSASLSSGYLWNTGATTQNITVNVAGSYSVKATGNCGSTSAAVIVTTNSLAIPFISASGPLSFCNGDSVILTASVASSYLWSTGAMTQKIIVKAAGSYTVTSSGTCSGTSAPTIVTINPVTIPTIMVTGSPTFCQGDSIILTTSALSGIHWSTGETNQRIVIKTMGNYTVTTSGFCGGKSVAIGVIVNPTMIPTISSSGSLALCPGGSVVLTSSLANKYKWSNGDTSHQIIVKSAGNYTVTTPGICTGVSASTIVTLNSARVPLITASGPLKFCTGDSVILTSTSDGGYLWSTSDTTRSIIVKNSGTYTVHIPGACSDTSAPVIVSVGTNFIPPITASGPTSFCIGGSVVLSTSVGSFYRWSIVQSVEVRETGTYWVRVNNECGYHSSTGFKVNVYPGPDCSITTKSPFCKVESTQLCAETNNSKYLWSTGDTTQCITISHIGTFSVTVTNELGCSNTCSKTITAIQYPDCTITGDTSICDNQTAILSAPSGDVTYQWNTGATTQTIKIVKPGVYTVSVTNANGCTSTCSKTVKGPSITCSIMGNVNLCVGESTELKGPMGAKSYLWSTGSIGGWINVHEAGTYTLTMTNTNGCVSQCSQIVTVTTCIVCLPAYGIIVPNYNTLSYQKLVENNIPKHSNTLETRSSPIVNFETQAFPNPFVHTTMIVFSSSNGSERIKVEVYNLQGRKVASLFEGVIGINEHRKVRFDATGLSYGIYFYRVTDGKFMLSKKIVLLKN